MVAIHFKSTLPGRNVTFANCNTFGYHPRSEVSSATVQSNAAVYAYDDIGNFTSNALGNAVNSYGANNLNQYAIISSMAGNVSPTYDLDGNLLTNGVWCYTYDAANRLATVSSNGILFVSNHYDAQSHRVQKITASATHTYFYDGWNLVEERIVHPSGATESIQYVWGKDLSGTLQGAGGVGGLLWIKRSGALYFPCYDNNSNVTAYINESGIAVASYIYDAFGNTVELYGTMSADFSLRFSTKYQDPETGMYYYGRRFYMPTHGRWLNRDPIEENGGENLYAFCRNNSLCYIDAKGEHPAAIIIGILILSALNPDVANAPGPDDPTFYSGGAAGMFIDLAAGQVLNLGLKCCGKAIGSLKFRVFGIRAEKARNALASATSKEHAVAVGVFDAKTGCVTAQTSARYIDKPTPVLRALSDKIGGVGTRTQCGNTIGCCAEFHGANELIKGGSLISDIRFTAAIRPSRPSKIISPCDNCLQMFQRNFSAGPIPVEMPRVLFLPTQQHNYGGRE